MDARLTQAESAYLIPGSASPARERAVAQRLAAGEAHQAGLMRGAAHALARLGDVLFGWIERARIRAELNSLTDRDLADIGLSRGEIGRVVAAAPSASDQPVGRRPARIGAQHPA